ncbi:MAG: replicative DNA helicase [Bacteroidia bacterium]|nr:replicative DNA helicase [Bacteroidia bacterium]
MAEKKIIKNATVPLQIVSDNSKIPPQALDVEEAVLGQLMLEKDAVISVLDILKPSSFYNEAHQKIYSAIVDLSMKERPVDILTVTEELKKKEQLDLVGGPFYITQLTSRVGSAAHIEYHARIIAQKFIQRELIRISSEIQERAFDENEDVLDLLEFSESELFKIAEGNIKKEVLKINVVLKEAIHQIEEAGKKQNYLSGIPSGYSDIDRITSGWQNSDLIIIAARPSMGKTAFALTMARNITIEHNRTVAFFSLEMSSIQLVNRLIISETELDTGKIKTGNLAAYEWKQLEEKIKNLSNAKIFIDDTPAISIFEFRAKCRRLKLQHKVDLIIIDYLQLITTNNENRGTREQEVSAISRALKAIAKELDVPIIALSQMNRSIETRGGTRRPQLSDLRESGAIEQDADMVIFIHRPEKYGLSTDEKGNSLVGLAEIIIAKHRNGATGEVQLKFINRYAKFTEFDNISGYPEEYNNNTNHITLSSKMNNDTDNNQDDIDLTTGSSDNPAF